MNDIIESDELDQLLDACEKKETGIYAYLASDDPAGCDMLTNELLGGPE